MYDDSGDFFFFLMIPVVFFVIFFSLFMVLSSIPDQICVAKNSTVKVDDKYCDYEFDGYHWIDKP